ncbi:MAG: hypothetical protein C4536_12540 [Actinobacteria bacterium]|jgi:hypothetical protein|nr:MAG: hypothetical protein C4536_12540 [Actinomycetota bacterium]
MKRAVVIALVAALALSMLAVLAGCGGDANKDEAVQHMNAGDNYYDAVMTAWTGVEDAQAEIAAKAMEGDMAAFTGEAGEAMIQGFADSFEKVSTDLENAFNEYEAITGLDGVDDYKEYAEVRMEAIEIWKKMVAAADQLLTDLVGQLATIEAGKELEFLTQLMESEELAAIGEMADQIETLDDEAEQIKLDKKLEQ